MQFSKISGALRWSQGTIVLRVGQTIEDDHPLLLERPDIFTEEDPGADIRQAPATRVETTMQRPGEQRTVKGPKPNA